jgi:hypothetical protein
VDAGVDSNFPFYKLHITTLNYGRGIPSMYYFSHSYLELDCYIALGDYNFRVYDKRYEYTYEDSDGNTNISHEFALLRADGKNWYSNVSGTLTLSYAIQISNIFYLKSSIGYDFIRPIKTELVNETIGISANWDEFNTYYGVPSMNLCEVSKGIDRICTMRKIHFGLCICLRV